MKRKYEIVVLSKGSYARTLRIYSPRKADRAIIMHDGQNVFYDTDAAYKKSWRAIDMLKLEKVKNTAIIGIDNTKTREHDYFPFPTELATFGMPPTGGGADTYCDFIESTVLPYLDKRFGYKFYGMLGSSAGASATLHFAARKNTRFRAYGLFSTPLFVAPKAYDRFIETSSFDQDALYYVYVGGKESEELVGEYSKLVPELYVDSAFTAVKMLRRSNVKYIRMRLENRNVHDETSWRYPEHEFFRDFSALPEKPDHAPRRSEDKIK